MAERSRGRLQLSLPTFESWWRLQFTVRGFAPTALRAYPTALSWLGFAGGWRNRGRIGYADGIRPPPLGAAPSRAMGPPVGWWLSPSALMTARLNRVRTRLATVSWLGYAGRGETVGALAAPIASAHRHSAPPHRGRWGSGCMCHSSARQRCFVSCPAWCCSIGFASVAGFTVYTRPPITVSLPGNIGFSTTSPCLPRRSTCSP